MSLCCLSLYKLLHRFSSLLMRNLCLLQLYRTTGTREHHRSGRSRRRSLREDRALFYRARANPFSTGKRVSELWPLPSRVSDSTMTRRLNCAGLKSKYPVKRPKLTPRHKRPRLEWAYDKNTRYRRRINFSDDKIYTTSY